MPQICHKCRHEGRLLQGVSQVSWFNYHRCDRCGHVWISEKLKSNSPVQALAMVKGGLVTRRSDGGSGPLADSVTGSVKSRR